MFMVLGFMLMLARHTHTHARTLSAAAAAARLARGEEQSFEYKFDEYYNFIISSHAQNPLTIACDLFCCVPPHPGALYRKVFFPAAFCFIIMMYILFGVLWSAAALFTLCLHSLVHKSMRKALTRLGCVRKGRARARVYVFVCVSFIHFVCEFIWNSQES